MIQNLLASLLIAVISGLTADIYVNILTQPGMILAGWARWLNEVADKYCKPDPYWPKPEFDDQVEAWINERRKRADFWLKPILTCIYCVSGQMGFWLSIILAIAFHSVFLAGFSIITACLSIYFGGIIQYIQHKYFPFN